jgi:hypothetical protein
LITSLLHFDFIANGLRLKILEGRFFFPERFQVVVNKTRSSCQLQFWNKEGLKKPLIVYSKSERGGKIAFESHNGMPLV